MPSFFNIDIYNSHLLPLQRSACLSDLISLLFCQPCSCFWGIVSFFEQKPSSVPTSPPPSSFLTFPVFQHSFKSGPGVFSCSSQAGCDSEGLKLQVLPNLCWALTNQTLKSPSSFVMENLNFWLPMGFEVHVWENCIWKSPTKIRTIAWNAE